MTEGFYSCLKAFKVETSSGLFVPALVRKKAGENLSSQLSWPQSACRGQCSCRDPSQCRWRFCWFTAANILRIKQEQIICRIYSCGGFKWISLKVTVFDLFSSWLWPPLSTQIQYGLHLKVDPNISDIGIKIRSLHQDLRFKRSHTSSDALGHTISVITWGHQVFSASETLGQVIPPGLIKPWIVSQ